MPLGPSEFPGARGYRDGGTTTDPDGATTFQGRRASPCDVAASAPPSAKGQEDPLSIVMSWDIVLLAAGFAAALIAIGIGARERPLGVALWVGILVLSVTSAATVRAGWASWAQPSAEPLPEERVENRPIAVTDAGYLSPETCRACHPHHHETWRASHHRTMTQVPSEASVIADFDDHTLQRYGREFRFYREGDGFFMDMKRPRPNAATKPVPAETFELVLSTGAHHQQAFWFATDEGRTLGQLPFIWITAEDRWVPYGSIFVAPPSRPSMQTGTWNKTCIKCHVVGGQPRLEESGGHDSRVGEFGVSCGACHGEAAEHVALHRNPLHRYREHLSSDDDPTLVSAADLSHENSSQVCGQCHSIFELFDDEAEARFDREGFAYRPGDDLHASRHVFRHDTHPTAAVAREKLASSPRFLDRRFWPDGMVRVSGREYNGLLETPCFERGTMSCLSCHSMHPDADDRRPRAEWADDQLRPGMRGNEACIQCHADFEADATLVAHTHHAPGSSGSTCYNCHMPHTTLGLMKAMRSHTVDSPDVASTVATGRPNACNLCHLNETLAWTSGHLADWYGIEPPPLSAEQKTVASSIRWLLEGDAGQRAIAGWHFGWGPAQEASGTAWMGAHLPELLTDSYDVVRFIGYHSLRKLPGFAEFEYDFVGPEASRPSERARAIATWHASAERPPPSASLLIGIEGRRDEARAQALRARRVDPPVVLAE